MRRSILALALAVALAGCTWPEPAPTSPSVASSDGGAAVASPAPPARAPCVNMLASLRSGEPAMREEGAQVELTLWGTCPEAVLVDAGPCPGDLVVVQLRGENDTPLGFLRVDGAPDAMDAQCPGAAASREVPIPATFGLHTLRRWNGSLRAACDGPTDGCARLDPAPSGYYRFRVEAMQKDGTRISQTLGFRLATLCADVWVDLPEGHAGALAIDNVTLAEPWQLDGEGAYAAYTEDIHARWCGEPGEHWVRVDDRTAGTTEEALLVLDARGIRLVLAPLRVEPELGADG